MKIVMLALSAALGLALTASAGEPRVFFNPDRSKSFQGQLTGFDMASQKVTVRLTNGRTITFPLGTLSKEDQEFVREKGALLGVANFLDVEMTDVSERGEKAESGNFYITRTDGKYDIAILNRGKSAVGNFEVKYRLYYEDAVRVVEEKRIDVDRIEKFQEGSFTVEELHSGQQHNETTNSVALLHERQKPLSQCTGGG